jgi:hypothetical protein
MVRMRYAGLIQYNTNLIPENIVYSFFESSHIGLCTKTSKKRMMGTAVHISCSGTTQVGTARELDDGMLEVDWTKTFSTQTENAAADAMQIIAECEDGPLYISTDVSFPQWKQAFPNADIRYMVHQHKGWVLKA